jgi:hypothetical protein
VLSPTAWKRHGHACSPRLPPSQWRSLRTTNAIERLHEEFKRRIKRKLFCRRPTPPRCCSGRCSLQGRSTCAKWMVGRPSPQSPSISRLTLPPETIPSCYRRTRHTEFQPHSGRHRTRLMSFVAAAFPFLDAGSLATTAEVISAGTTQIAAAFSRLDSHKAKA